MRTIASNREHNHILSSQKDTHTLRFETGISVVVGLRFSFSNLQFRFLQKLVG